MAGISERTAQRLARGGGIAGEFVRELRTDPDVLHGFVQQSDITPEQQWKATVQPTGTSILSHLP